MNSNGSTSVLGIAVFALALIIIAVFAGLVVQTTSEATPYSNNTTSGQTRETGDDLIAQILPMFPLLAIASCFVFGIILIKTWL